MKSIALRPRCFDWCGGALLAIMLMTPSLADAEAHVPPGEATWESVARVDWRDGLSEAVSEQANPGGIEVVPDPEDASRKVLRAAIARNENFTHVANGSPRAEVLFREPASFAQGSDYLLQWSTYLPRNFEFDGKQMVIVSQIHPSGKSGSPTLALTLLGTNYYISTRGGMQVQRTTAGAKLCCAENDRGHWVYWTLRYIPDDSGQQSLTQLWKNGVSVFHSEHVANAYLGDQHSYLKVGLYKSGWLKEPSDVEVQTMFYGPVSILRRKTNLTRNP
ncbi:heparin lyase I family protein [Paraburkholderia bannensis]|uniref:heparin lyase I family protein n=1 Tax=Paraburkholderia bannensis TaxID=765414 RepID=UPI002AB651F9|nr:heparin lyase I family protein [Paraburkholderia bannensis]